MIQNLLIVSAFLCAGFAHADRSTVIEPFQKGDRVCFIGDSITHGGTYHSEILLYYVTRFPDTRFHVNNCGISGDTAPGTLQRFELDIAPRQPTVATIMLGMNDCVDSSGFGKYAHAMRELAERLTDGHCRVIFITPSIYDATAMIDAPSVETMAVELKSYADFIPKLAAGFGGGVVDFYGPMESINAEQQERAPSFTIVGPDRVHPGPVGHLIMAYAFLKAQGMPKYVSRAHLDARSGGLVHEDNCSVDDIASMSGKLGATLKFRCREFALPYPVSEAASLALTLVSFQEDLNQEILQVDGLDAGAYALTIDDLPVGEYTNDQLREGVNLATNPATPQHRQALRVRALGDERFAVQLRIRAIASVEAKILPQLGLRDTDQSTLEKGLHDYLDSVKDQPWCDQVRSMVDTYLAEYRDKSELLAQNDALIDRMFEASQPVAHRWMLAPLAME